MALGLPLAAAVLGGLLPAAAGHAYLAEPPSRNLMAYARGEEICPHCLQSGGPPTVKERSKNVWPTKDAPGSHGLCGDPVQGASTPVRISDESYLKPTAIERNYRPGQIVEFVVGVSTHHLGHYEFRICDRVLDQTLASAEEGQACLNKYLLKRAPVDPSCVPDDPRGDCQPIDEKHPERWYLPPPHGDTQVAGMSWADDMANNLPALTETHVMRYVIPEDLVCTHCTLQFYWSTGNTCVYDGDYMPYFQSMKRLGWSAENWSPIATAEWARCEVSCCGPQGKGAFAEEFWNCADIAVVPAGGASQPAPLAPGQATAPAATAAPVAEPTSPPTGPGPAPQPASQSASQPAPQPAQPTKAPRAGPGGCAPLYEQCGGMGHLGPMCCEQGVCRKLNQWYHQCNVEEAALAEVRLHAPRPAPAGFLSHGTAMLQALFRTAPAPDGAGLGAAPGAAEL